MNKAVGIKIGIAVGIALLALIVLVAFKKNKRRSRQGTPMPSLVPATEAYDEDMPAYEDVEYYMDQDEES